MSPNRSDYYVLIVATDPLLAALLGGLVESTRLKAAFPRERERTEDALARVKPLAALLVDAALEEAASDVLLTRARKRDTVMLLFGHRADVGRRGEWTSSQGVDAFVLPDETDKLRVSLENWRASGSGDVRSDRRARTERKRDGQLILVDDAGRRWSVYDRRGDDRRRPVHRSFVSESGEVRGCDLEQREATSESPDVLQGQLSRATIESAS